MNRLLKDVVEYVGLTDKLVDFLSKKASAASEPSKPVFSDAALHKAADALVKVAYVKSSDRALLVETLRNNPDAVLESLSKLAFDMAGRKYRDSFRLGKPSAGNPAPQMERESDRVLYEKLGLA